MRPCGPSVRVPLIFQGPGWPQALLCAPRFFSLLRAPHIYLAQEGLGGSWRAGEALSSQGVLLWASEGSHAPGRGFSWQPGGARGCKSH